MSEHLYCAACQGIAGPDCPRRVGEQIISEDEIKHFADVWRDEFAWLAQH